MAVEQIPFYERLTCTVPDAIQATGIGRTTLYALMKQGAVKTTKIGTRTLISVASLKQLANSGSAMEAA